MRWCQSPRIPDEYCTILHKMYQGYQGLQECPLYSKAFHEKIQKDIILTDAYIDKDAAQHRFVYCRSILAVYLRCVLQLTWEICTYDPLLPFPEELYNDASCEQSHSPLGNAGPTCRASVMRCACESACTSLFQALHWSQSCKDKQCCSRAARLWLLNTTSCSTHICCMLQKCRLSTC